MPLTVTRRAPVVETLFASAALEAVVEGSGGGVTLFDLAAFHQPDDPMRREIDELIYLYGSAATLHYQPPPPVPPPVIPEETNEPVTGRDLEG